MVGRFGAGGRSAEGTGSHGAWSGAGRLVGGSGRLDGRGTGDGAGLRRAGSLGGEDALASHGEGANDEDAGHPDDKGNEDGHGSGEGFGGDDGGGLEGMGGDCHGDAPPGEDGVHGGTEEPGTEEVPDLARFVGALFGGKEAGDACEVNAAEGNGEDGCPGDAKELEIAEEVLEGKIGGGVIEHLEGNQGSKDHQPKGKAGADAGSEAAEGGRGMGGREFHGILLSKWDR